MSDEYKPQVGDRVAVVGTVTGVGDLITWVRSRTYAHMTGAVPTGALRPDPTAELEALRARVAELEAGAAKVPATMTVREAARRRLPLDGADAHALEGALTITERERDQARAALEEREAAMHLRIRADYDRTVADCWRAENARLAAERDQARARVAELEAGAAAVRCENAGVEPSCGGEPKWCDACAAAKPVEPCGEDMTDRGDEHRQSVCTLARGHAGAHEDPSTGASWTSATTPAEPTVWPYEGEPFDAADVRALLDENETLRRALRDVEWAGGAGASSVCPTCGADKYPAQSRAHSDSCSLAAALSGGATKAPTAKPAEPVDVDAALALLRWAVDCADIAPDGEYLIVCSNQWVHAADCDALAKAFADLARHLRGRT